MNKTVSINLGGYFYHIDEDAYKKLSNYLEAIKRSLSPEGREEIIKDIETRISELFSEKIKNEKQVIGNTEVEQVIAIMGQPEDYKIGDETTANYSTSSSSYQSTTRRWYRDKDNSMLGGVLSGLGHYFNTDPLWFRIIMVILFFGYGVGFLVYVMLWILVPEAKTTSEKLAMKGEPINISNIEKKVKEEFEDVSNRLKQGIGDISEKINNGNYKNLNTKIKSGSQQLGNTVSDIVLTIFKVLSKILGSLLILIGSGIVISLFVSGIVALFVSPQLNLPWGTFIDLGEFSDIPFYIFLWTGILVLAIPSFFLAISGLKLMVPHSKSLGTVTRYVLISVWVCALVFLIYFAVQQATAVSFDSKTVVKETIITQPTDTLQVKFRFNDYYAKSVDEYQSIWLTEDEKHNSILYSNRVTLIIKPSDITQPYLQVEKIAAGKSLVEARKRSEKITYGYSLQNNTLVLDNYFITPLENKQRNQRVNIYLYLPINTYLKTDTSLQKFTDFNSSQGYISYDQYGYTYQVQQNSFKCLNCPKQFTESTEISTLEQEIEESLNEVEPIIKSDTVTK